MVNGSGGSYRDDNDSHSHVDVVLGCFLLLFVSIVSFITVYFYWYLPIIKRGDLFACLMCMFQTVH